MIRAIVALLLVFTSCNSVRNADFNRTTELAISHPKKHSKKHHISLTAPKKDFVPTVVIDPGHGGFDQGAHTRYCEEKNVCLRIGHLLRKHLEKMGYGVIMTRTIDEYVSLKDRAEVANKAKSQVLVSLHFNSAPSSSAQGLEVFYFPKAESFRLKRSKDLAIGVLHKLIALTGAKSRGIKEGDFCVIRETKMPSILIEGGFLTNEEEQKKIIDERYLEKMAEAIALGLDSYFKAQ